MRPGRLLVVDDAEDNRLILARRLQVQGYKVASAENGKEAVELLQHKKFDLILLDIVMPEMDGFQVLEWIKSQPRLSNIPVVILSALDDISSVVRCIQLGAADYLTKPFDPVLLKARVESCLQKKRFHDRERRYSAALKKAQVRLLSELAKAASYVVSLLPPPLNGGVKLDWHFIPSDHLGGDAFGYHWLDPDHLAIYLLDVSGHGIESALLSISVMEMLRSQNLPATNFQNPAEVLSRLNQTFQMTEHNNKYFTMFYAVYDLATQELTYCNGGHPPPIIVTREGDTSTAVPLSGTNLIVGGLPSAVYHNDKCIVKEQSSLYIFSDGLYEVKKTDGTLMEYEEFMEIVRTNWGVQPIIQEIERRCGTRRFTDDVSLLHLHLKRVLPWITSDRAPTV